MNFIQTWGKTLLFLTILGIVLGALTRFFIYQPLYWLTGYIFVVSGLILLVRKKFTNRSRDVDITDLELASLSGAPFNLSEILLHEFDYVKDTASQAMNDRHTMINYFLLSAGVVVTGIGVLLSKEGAADFQYRESCLVAMSLLFSTVGWIYFLQLVRLRQAWCDSARAMNHIKRIFVHYSGNQPHKAQKVFLWNIDTIPRANAKMTVFHLSALLIAVLSAVAIALTAVILLGEKEIGRFWYIAIILGLYHLTLQMSMYTSLLKETYVSTSEELYRTFINENQTPNEDEKRHEQFKDYLRQKEAAGELRRVGEKFLDRPGLLEAYKSAIVNAAKEDPNSMGSIIEENVLAGGLGMPEDIRIKEKEIEKFYIIMASHDLINDGIAVRESTENGPYLVFPDQFANQYQDLTVPEGDAVIFTFRGSILTIYVRLAVHLLHSGLFKKKELWRNAVTYTTKNGGVCGLFLEEIKNDIGKVRLFFNAEANEETRSKFDEYVYTYLQNRALPESINRQRIFVCSKCATPVTSLQVDRRRERGYSGITCNVCGEHVSLLDYSERILEGRATPTSVLQDKIASGNFDVFLCHNNIDKEMVKKIGKQLKERDILPWLDEWELQPGLPWPKALEQQIEKIKSAAVFVGVNSIGPWQDMEINTFLRQFVKRGCPVIPVILPDCKETPEVPAFLANMTWVDFRRQMPDPLERLIWGITGRRS